ncbi:MAG: hypothetical protein GF417_12660 [Candidatus Latescibacteria bacterium]|nr:hypothetical protein [Candidatus Latescibacterota bacterium]
MTSVILCCLVIGGCSEFKKVEREIINTRSFQELSEENLESIRESSPFLKVHMKSGEIYVLGEWWAEPDGESVCGAGVHLSAARDTLKEGEFHIGIGQVAVFETNSLKTSSSVKAIAVFTGITAAVTTACIINPKACFGSCPTFYIQGMDRLRPRAEGFSASIAPSLEASDIDDLDFSALPGEDFGIEMRNEALETHVVRHVDLLAVPRNRASRALADAEGIFWEAEYLQAPVSARGSEGDCLELLAYRDSRERFSKADSSYLGSKEIIELEFRDLPEENAALMISCRQTLLSTYLLYQAYAYMGSEAGAWFARIARGEINQSEDSIHELLGGIQILIEDSKGGWKTAGRISEYGPLAVDTHLIHLDEFGSRSQKVRLKMTRGNWRIDRVALASLSKRIEPVRIHPHLVIRGKNPDRNSRELLLDSQRVLTTLPGNTYYLRYKIPSEEVVYDLFVESRGYYLEWIRKEWVEEENPQYLAQMFLSPERALRRLAPQYKKVEDKMEYHFWRSRYVKQ